MLPALDTYDWKEAFGYCGEPGTNCTLSCVDLRAAIPESGVSLAPFSREDVCEISHSIEGENDESPWRMVGKLKDGRWFYLEAGCDYTGWDCQAGGSACLAESYNKVIAFGCTKEARSLFGIAEPTGVGHGA